MVEAFKQYNSLGIFCLPTKPDKSPDVKGTWKGGVSSGYENAHGIGLICGTLSGGLECMDFDNHFGDAKETLSAFINLIKPQYEQYKFPIESTLTGGYHLIYRCNKIEGNQKLASLYKNNKPDAIIETRGEGGYFVAAPTSGYKWIRNDINNIPVISIEDREILINAAKSFNGVAKTIKTSKSINSDRPGDEYDNDPSAIVDMKNSLLRAGWKDNGFYWTRPDKESGISATLGKVAPNVFYVFTVNADPFDSETGYTPFQVVGLLDYKGDFSAFAKDLAEKYNLQPSYKSEKKVIEKTDFRKLLDKSYIDLDIPIARPPICMEIRDGIKDRRLFTLGNFSAITGKGKSKKTFLSSLLLAAATYNGIIQNKLIGRLPESKRGVLLFDTEQGLYDAYIVSKRVIDLIGHQCQEFGSFALREYTPDERCEIIEEALKLYNDSIGYVVIDGIADLTSAINDEEKATKTVGLLMRWTKQYNCHITVIIHQNKNDEFATGHLGSTIIKKSEAVIKVSKIPENTSKSKVECDLIRGVADFEPFEFMINEYGLPIIDNENSTEYAF